MGIKEINKIHSMSNRRSTVDKNKARKKDRD